MFFFSAAPTQTPVVEQKLTYTFKLSYRVRVDCSNQAAVNGLLSNIKLKILSRLRTLAQRFLNFCVSSDVSNCFASLELRFKNCAQPQGKRRKRQTADNDFEVEAIIPNIRYVLFNILSYRCEMLIDSCFIRKTFHQFIPFVLLWHIW